MTRTLRLAAAAALAVCFYSFPAGSDDTSETYRQLNLFGDVFERVRSSYVEEVGDKELVEAAINGMLSSLDPHSSYMDPQSFEDMQVQTKGEFGGLGIEVTMENGVVRVVSPIDDTPAFKAGLQPGDYIVQIDGEPVMGLTLSQAVDKMRGPVDSPIKLTIQRGQGDPFDVTLKRAVIKIQSVRSRLEGNDIGYVRITSFSEQTDVGLKAAIDKLKQQSNNKLIGLVLDLRNNPGGLLDQAIAVSDDFIDQGEIVSTRGRDPKAAQRFNATPGDITGGLPMVVLINSGSASASEIVAGALQDHHRAILMGTTSFGKGSVQTIIPLPGHGAIRLTTARYYTPSGRSIQGTGIVPDIEVRQAKVEEIPGQVEHHESELRGALNNDGLKPDQGQNQNQNQNQNQDQNQNQNQNQTPPSGGGSSSTTPPAGATPAQTPAPGEGDVAQDYQLGRALDLLRGLALIQAQKSN
ncbi:MAG TPA: S41 family peptidase [Hypericibacter adhaerens]|uniref:S41 family peptidase n=1 Tax=Hypericibacter adhaerens TaxID=2602016 RepID=UPI002BA0F530|nr:S41 family peptidase [Hypericibacter adhaerens]HWA43722.1 S41 family peptidase [Hypericibacter adhaerens]